MSEIISWFPNLFYSDNTVRKELNFSAKYNNTRATKNNDWVIVHCSSGSDLRKVGSGRADVNVVAWISDQVGTSFYISVLTLMELEIGILCVERRDIEQGT